MTGGFFLSKLDISKNTLTQIPALYELVSGWLILNLCIDWTIRRTNLDLDYH